MSSLFASLNASSLSLSAFQRAIDISRNNVNNSSTPGYAAEIADFSSLSFSSGTGLAGGVTVSGESTRNTALDRSVNAQLTGLGNAQQQASSLASVQSLFDVSGATGVPAALTKLFSSFSQLSVAPADASARNSVVSAAQDAATAFNQISTSLSQASADSEQQINSQLGQINSLAKEIQGYNLQAANSPGADAGRDAKLSTAVEKLSSLANITTRTGANGGTDVLLDGQIPLVLGTEQYSLSSGLAPAASPAPLNPNGKPQVLILDNGGQDITSHVTGGSVAGLLQFRNSTLPQLAGDRNQNGQINTLAKSFADRVNAILTAGVVSAGPPVQQGTAIFTYDSTDATKTASSLAVVSGFTGSQLAAISPGPPAVSNGTALSLADLGRGTAAQNQIGGLSYQQYFGALAGTLGTQLNTQKNSADLYQQSSIQSKSLRSQISGVSLDTEAVRLTEYQKAYSASAKLITVLDQIAQTTLDILK